MSSETNSDTLRDLERRIQDAGTPTALEQDAIEYAAQLERALKKKRGAFQQAAQAAQRRGVERDDALKALRAMQDDVKDAIDALNNGNRALAQDHLDAALYREDAQTFASDTDQEEE